MKNNEKSKHGIKQKQKHNTKQSLKHNTQSRQKHDVEQKQLTQEHDTKQKQHIQEQDMKQKLLTWEQWQELTGVQAVIWEYRDTVFRMLLRDKRKLLALYNGINGTNYDNPDDLEIVTLENAIYMSCKNDVACVIDFTLDMYEQQSTVNPNMPFRYLRYVSRVFEKLTVYDNIYSRKLIKLPTPKFIVFYNGSEPQPECKEYRLSDAYITKTDRVNLELIVTQLNINEGYNSELLEKCPELWEYMQYVSKIREYNKDMPLEEAVPKAVDECINEGILKEFLLLNKAEVVSMSIFEYDAELHMKMEREEAFEDGRAEGIERGVEQGRMKNLITLVCRKLRKSKEVDIIADELEEDIEVISEICKVAENYAPDYNEELVYEAYKEQYMTV
ncbi:MAG: hypothetical protein NC428_10555 [Clostridium sp.]|nr:hypothetical protein [Clostridium sp.]